MNLTGPAVMAAAGGSMTRSAGGASADAGGNIKIASGGPSDGATSHSGNVAVGTSDNPELTGEMVVISGDTQADGRSGGISLTSKSSTGGHGGSVVVTAILGGDGKCGIGDWCLTLDAGGSGGVAGFVNAVRIEMLNCGFLKFEPERVEDGAAKL